MHTCFRENIVSACFFSIFEHVIEKNHFTHVGHFLNIHATEKYYLQHAYFWALAHAVDKKTSRHASLNMLQRKNTLRMLVFLFPYMPQ